MSPSPAACVVEVSLSKTVNLYLIIHCNSDWRAAFSLDTRLRGHLLCSDICPVGSASSFSDIYESVSVPQVTHTELDADQVCDFSLTQQDRSECYVSTLQNYVF